MFPNGYFTQTYFAPTYFHRPSTGGTGSFVEVDVPVITGSRDPVKHPGKGHRLILAIAGSLQ